MQKSWRMVVSVTLGRHFADFLKPTISSSVLVISSPIQPTHCQGAPSSTGTACNWEARLLDSRSSQKRSNQTQETCKALCVAVSGQKEVLNHCSMWHAHRNCSGLCHLKPFQPLLVVREQHIVVVGPTYTLFILQWESCELSQDYH